MFQPLRFVAAAFGPAAAMGAGPAPVRVRLYMDVHVRQAWFSLLRYDPAVNRHGMTGDEGSSVGTQSDHGLGNFFRLADPSYRFAGDDAVHQCRLAHQRFRHRRLNEAWTNAIDPNALFRILQRRRFGESDDAVLTGDIG